MDAEGIKLVGMAAGKHSTAAVVHGLRTWRLLLLPSIIGERAPALSTLVLYHLLFSALSI